MLQALRLQFLRCREEWLGELIAELDPGSAYEYLKRLTDVHRLHMFDVVMQYRAIFSDESAGQVCCLERVLRLKAGTHQILLASGQLTGMQSWLCLHLTPSVQHMRNGCTYATCLCNCGHYTDKGAGQVEFSTLQVGWSQELGLPSMGDAVASLFSTQGRLRL